MKKKEQKVQNQNINQDEPEILEETKELEQDTKLNNEMLKLEEEIHALQEEKKSLEEKVKLSQAELVNYRKRKDEETENLLKYANQSLVTELLPIVDNFERALAGEENASEEFKKYFAGFKMMYTNLLSILAKFGVEEINRVGEVFDPKQEQALLTDSKDEVEDEVVLEVLQKGYKLKDRVIRPASVKINQK